MKLKKVFFVVCFFVVNLNVFAQKLYNTKVKAEINVEYSSEFLTITALSENVDYSDYSLQYEFLTFKTDANNNTSKSNQSNRFFLKGNEKKILSSVIINNNEEGKVILILLIYPISDDEKQGAIGKDRIVITNKGGVFKVEYDDEEKNKELVNKDVNSDSKDQDSASKDGLFFEGLVIQKTLTKAGRDFHRYFYSEYYNKQIKTDKNIIIEEVPGKDEAQESRLK